MPVITRSRASTIRSPTSTDSSTRPSKMQTLIPDILVQIFRNCVQVENLFSLSGLKAPITVTALSAVCKHWRDVVLDNPLLWGYITMLDISKQNMALLNLCLERSRSVPISLNMLIRKYDPQLRPGDAASGGLSLFDRVFGSLAGQQRRWKAVEMLFIHDIEMPICKWFLDDMPLLEKLVLRTPIDYKFGAPSFCIDLSRSPRLKSLGLFGDIKVYPTPSLSLENLTAMTLDHFHPLQHFPSVSDCLAIISLAPNLRHLALYPSCPSLPSTSALPHVVLPELVRLNVGAHGERAVITTLLAHLTLPALRELRIVNDVMRLRWQDEVARSNVPYGIPELLTRSRQPPLTNFSLESVIENEIHLFVALAHMPYLRNLKIASCCTISLFTFEALTLRHATSDKPARLPCPFLERIDLVECTLAHRSDTSIKDTVNRAAEMIASRWNCAPLQRKLRHFGAIHSELGDLNKNPLIARCISEGLCLNCTEDGFDESRKKRSVQVI